MSPVTCWCETDAIVIPHCDVHHTQVGHLHPCRAQTQSAYFVLAFLLRLLLIDSQDQYQQALAHAVSLHQSGQLTAATDQYQQLLVRYPDSAELMQYLGIACLQTGKAGAAVNLFRSALQREPHDGGLLMNLGTALQQTGENAAAATVLKQALGYFPEHPALLANLGNCLLQLGEPVSALQHYQQSLHLNEHQPEVWRNVALCLLQRARVSEALDAIRRAEALAPGHPAILVAKGTILMEAMVPAEAAECFRQVLQQQPRAAEIWCNLGNALKRCHDMTGAFGALEKSLAGAPDYAEAHYSMGVWYEESGDAVQAEKHFRQALALDPYCARAWRSISHLGKGRCSAEDVGRMQMILEAESVSPLQRAEAAFALGKALEDGGDYSAAMDCYLQANRCVRDNIDYDPGADATLMTGLATCFSAEFIARNQREAMAGEGLIFIVGMPRSGTTLAEQILASHPQVSAGGERSDFPLAIAAELPMLGGADYTAAVATAEPGQLNQIARRYLMAVGEGQQPNQRHTDKLPMNFLNLGLISILFPAARVIHCRRHPVDTCLSVFRHHFAAHGHTYAYDLQELGAYYRHYERLMEHWRRVIPPESAFFELVYEDLINDQEGITRQLLAHCGLPWDDQCLQFHQTARPVATLSASQVRQPVYRDAIDRWKLYGDSIAPLLRALDQG
ncbi:MAG: sulfotransferase [Pseudomonadales bacterium]|nr:sulfotransferase [Pseudomonadales bacterium]